MVRTLCLLVAVATSSWSFVVVSPRRVVVRRFSKSIAEECLELANYKPHGSRGGFALAEADSQSDWQGLAEDLFEETYASADLPKGAHFVVADFAAFVKEKSLKMRLRDLAKTRDELKTKMDKEVTACLFLDDSGKELLESEAVKGIVEESLGTQVAEVLETTYVFPENNDLTKSLDKAGLKVLLDEKKIIVLRGSGTGELAKAAAASERAARVADEARITYRAAAKRTDIANKAYQKALEDRQQAQALRKDHQSLVDAYTAAARLAIAAKDALEASKTNRQTCDDARNALDEWNRISDEADAAMAEFQHVANRCANLRKIKKIAAKQNTPP